MNDDGDFHHDQADDGGVVKALSAYHHFNKLNSSSVRDELQKEGKDTGMGAVASAVSTKVRTL